MSEEEYTQLFKAYSHSSCHSPTAYIRQILTKGSVTVFYRNRSIDDLIHEMVGIKEALWQIRNLFSEQLQTLHHMSGMSELEAWVRVQEKDKCLLYDKTEELRELMIKLYDYASQDKPCGQR